MNSFWLKIGVLALIVVGLVVGVKIMTKSDPKPDTESSEVTSEVETDGGNIVNSQADDNKETPASDGADLNRVERNRTQRVDEYRRKRLEAIETANEQQPKEEELTVESLQAERLYRLAEMEFGVSRKIGGTFKKSVDACREILSKYPQSSYAPKAQDLLKRMPQRVRDMWNVTNEEMGL